MKLELALAQYTDALTNLKLAKSEPSEIEILHIISYSRCDRNKEAEKELRLAVALEEKIPEKQLGGGMAYCLLPEAREGIKLQTNEKLPADYEKEKSDWEKQCMSKARPETIDRYKWFIEKKREIIEYIKTIGVVDGESNPSTQP